MSSSTNRYIIQDWAGSRPFGDVEFESFEEGWEHIYRYAREMGWSEEECDENFGEFYVELVGDE